MVDRPGSEAAPSADTPARPEDPQPAVNPGDAPRETLLPPAAGEEVVVRVEPGEAVAVQFDPNSAQLSMDGGDLVMSFPNGGRIVLEDFAAASRGDAPTSIILPDGTVVAGNIVVAQLGGDQGEIETAAGPGAGGGRGGGGSRYSDDFGSAVKNLSAFGPLGRDAFGTSVPENEFGAAEEPQIAATPTDGATDGAPTAGEAANAVAETDIGTPAATVTGALPFAGGSITAIDGVTPVDGVITVTGDGYTLTVDAATGAYSFTLTGPRDHSGEGANPSFTYTVTDGDGDTAEGGFTVTVVDDAPEGGEAANDVAEADIGTPAATVTGTLPFAGGADGATLTAVNGVAAVDGVITVTGDGYTLTVDAATGAYSYTLTAAMDHGDGDSLTQAFTYTVTDGDGDTAEGGFTVTVADDAPEGGEAANDVAEADIGTPAATVTGTLPFAGGADGATLTAVNGVAPVDGVITVTGDGYTLTVDAATGAYSYTLTAAMDHGDGDSLTQAFTYTVTDGDGNDAEGSFTVTVADDLPVANDSAASVDEDDLPEPSSMWQELEGDPEAPTAPWGDSESEPVTITGKLDFAPGADGASVTAIAYGETTVAVGEVPGVIEGDNFRLEVDADGNYTYTLLGPMQHGEPGTDSLQQVFSYTVTDGDGDTASADLTVTIADDVPQIAAASGTVHESGWSENWWNWDLPSSWTFGAMTLSQGADGAEVTSVTYDGQTYNLEGGWVVIEGDHFNLEVYSDGWYFYEVTGAADHPAAGADSIKDVFTVTATDGDGDVASADLTITVVDGVPTAHDASDSVAEASEPTTVDGWLSFDDGGPDGASVTGISLGDQQGTWDGEAEAYVLTGDGFTLSVTATGYYRYVLDDGMAHEGDSLEQSFVYTVTDGDGDTASANLVITVEDGVPVASDSAATVKESALVDDSDGQSPTVTGTLSFDGGADGASITRVAFGDASATPDAKGMITLTGPGFTLAVVAATGAYTYTLTDSQQHAAAGIDSLVQKFTFTVTDGDGDSDDGELAITIVDDVPVAGDASASLSEAAIPGGAVATGTLPFTPGADGATLTAINGVAAVGGLITVAGDGYSLVVDAATGDYTYTLTAAMNHGGQDSLQQQFTFTVTDGDGDTDTGTFTVTIDDAAPKAVDNLADIHESRYEAMEPTVIDFDGPLTLETKGAVRLVDDSFSDDPDDTALELMSAGRGDDATAANPNQLAPFVKVSPAALQDEYEDAVPGWTSGGLKGSAALILDDAYFATGATVDITWSGRYFEGQQHPAEVFLTLHKDGDPDDAATLIRVAVVTDPSDVPVENSFTFNFADYGLEAGNYDVYIGVMGALGNDGGNGLGSVYVHEVTYGFDDGFYATTRSIDGDLIADDDLSGLAATVTAISYVDAGGNTVEANVGEAFTTLLGGTLRVEADGSYSYTAPQNIMADQVETFTYTVTNALGESDTATLTIDVLDQTGSIYAGTAATDVFHLDGVLTDADVITDFDPSADVLDLSEILPDIGADALEAYLQIDAGGNVSVDMDGDGAFTQVATIGSSTEPLDSVMVMLPNQSIVDFTPDDGSGAVT